MVKDALEVGEDIGGKDRSAAIEDGFPVPERCSVVPREGTDQRGHVKFVDEGEEQEL